MIYRSGSKNGGLVPGVALVVGGLFFAGRSALRVIEAVTEGEQRASIPLNLVFIAGALAAVYHGWTHLWMLAYEVRMPVDGSVEFVCVLRRKKLRAGEVTRIEKLVARFKDEGDDARDLHIHWRHGSVRVRYFDGITALVAELHRSNPGADVSGYWPGVVK